MSLDPSFGVLSLVMSVGGAWFMLNYFIKQPAESSKERDPALLSLYPLIFLTASSLVFGLFTGKFYWLYPLQCIMGAAGIYIVWDALRFEFKLKSAPVILGAAVFLVWIIVVGGDPVKDEIFKEELFGVSPLFSLTWLIFRIFGAVIVVPVAEELAFRSLFWNLIMNLSQAHLSSKWPVFFTLCVTSVAFGLLHSNIYAGFIAGVAYGLARLESGQVEDAIVAHITTNFLLSIYVLATGHWSYW